MAKSRKDFNINVFGEEWKVKYHSPIIEESIRAYGLCDHVNKTLYIDSTLDDQYTAVTFLHELFHAYFRRMGMINAGINHEVEEIIAEQFACLIAENIDFEL